MDKGLSDLHRWSLLYMSVCSLTVTVQTHLTGYLTSNETGWEYMKPVWTGLYFILLPVIIISFCESTDGWTVCNGHFKNIPIVSQFSFETLQHKEMKLGKQLLSLLCSKVHYYYLFIFFPNSTLLWLINHVNKTLYRHERERERELLN